MWGWRRERNHFMFTILGIESELCKICLYLLELADTLFADVYYWQLAAYYCLLLPGSFIE